jgi:hypothetical protein
MKRSKKGGRKEGKKKLLRQGRSQGRRTLLILYTTCFGGCIRLTPVKLGPERTDGQTNGRTDGWEER